jgi:transcriptional regulator with XRE-family HTH domain
MTELGPKLKGLRTTSGLSQRALARASGLTPSYVSKIESNSLSTVPSSDAIAALAHALKADELELLSAAGRVPSPFDVVGSHPEATRFFRAAAEKIDNPKDWERLTEMIESTSFGAPPTPEDDDG